MPLLCKLGLYPPDAADDIVLVRLGAKFDDRVEYSDEAVEAFDMCLSGLELGVISVEV